MFVINASVRRLIFHRKASMEGKDTEGLELGTGFREHPWGRPMWDTQEGKTDFLKSQSTGWGFSADVQNSDTKITVTVKRGKDLRHNGFKRFFYWNSQDKGKRKPCFSWNLSSSRRRGFLQSPPDALTALGNRVQGQDLFFHSRTTPAGLQIRVPSCPPVPPRARVFPRCY